MGQYCVLRWGQSPFQFSYAVAFFSQAKRKVSWPDRKSHQVPYSWEGVGRSTSTAHSKAGLGLFLAGSIGPQSLWARFVDLQHRWGLRCPTNIRFACVTLLCASQHANAELMEAEKTLQLILKHKGVQLGPLSCPQIDEPKTRTVSKQERNTWLLIKETFDFCFTVKTCPVLGSLVPALSMKLKEKKSAMRCFLAVFF